MLIVCIILGTALAAVLARLLLLKRDIGRIGRDLGEIIQTDTNAHVTTGTFDKDIVTLANNINALLERNRRGLFEKARAEAQLKRAITNIAHDLRTPLTSALGYMQMLASPESGAEAKARYAEIVRGRLEALSALMNNLFEFARVNEGITLDIREVNVCNALRDTLTASYYDLDARGFAVETNIPDAPVFFLCDEDALRRVLQNLIKNVCDHGKEYLRVGISNGAIEIANKAEGLDSLDTERLFDRFYTADAARTGKNTGLGLAIAQGLAARMNGRITAHVEDGLLIMRVGHFSHNESASLEAR